MTARTQESLIDALTLLERQANNRRGLTVLRDVIGYLQRGENDLAALTVCSEWDKIESQREIAALLIEAGLFTPIDFTQYHGDKG